MVGGAVNSSVGGCVDVLATLSLMHMNIDLGVLGACVVSSATGVSAHDLSDAAFNGCSPCVGEAALPIRG